MSAFRKLIGGVIFVSACITNPPVVHTPGDRAAEAARAAEIRADLGDFKAAVEFQRFVVASRPEKPEAWFRLAQIYHNAGLPRHGVWVLRAFVRRFPTNAWHVEAERLTMEWAKLTTCTAIGDEPEDETPSFTVSAP